jgi:MarR family transcriptional regulator, lower aerobic nicotinate degradation pathway regulator
LPDKTLTELYRRPGFMIRRAHQIAVSLFVEETGELGITTTQYGILFVLKHRPGVDQISVAKLLGLDRSTTGMVVNKLTQAGLVRRNVAAPDRRRRSLHLTRAGEKMLARLAAPAERARARVLSPLAPREQALFLEMLDKLTGSFNGSTRVPLDVHRVTDRDEIGLKAPARPRQPTARQRSAHRDHEDQA